MDMGHYIYEKFGSDEKNGSKIYAYFQENGLDELGEDGCIAAQLCCNYEFREHFLAENRKLKNLLGYIKRELEFLSTHPNKEFAQQALMEVVGNIINYEGGN